MLKVSYPLFQKILDDFSDTVDDGKYRKIDYGVWKKLASTSPTKRYIHQDFAILEKEEYSDCSFVHITLNKGKYDEYDRSFNKGDRSFGDFLFNWINTTKAHYFSKDFILENYDKQYLSSGFLKDLEMSDDNTVIYFLEKLDKDKITLILEEDDTVANIEKYNLYTAEKSISACREYARFFITNKDKLKTKNPTTEKESGTMKKGMFGLNVEFGKCGSDYKLSLYGIAVKNQAGNYVAYDAATNSIMDVDAFNFNSEAFLFKAPVALKDVKVGDVIIHNASPMFVKSVGDNGDIKAVDISSSDIKEILPIKNVFGFNFVTKVINLIGDLSAGATADNPFGNLLMMSMMADGDSDMNPFVMMALMNQKKDGNDNPMGDLFSNPLMMMAMMGNDDNTSMKDMLPFFLMNQMK